jgi:tRNA (cmo5U34)-methyltransferase
MARFTAKAASDYDVRIPRLVPGYQLMHEIATAYLLETLPAEADILVVGAGTGTEVLMLAAASPGWRFTAVDESAAMLEVAQDKMAEAGWSARARFITAPMQHVAPLPPHDAATCLLVSHFAPDDGDKLRFVRAIAERLQISAPLVLFDYLAAPVEMARLYRRWAMLQGAPAVEGDAILTRIATNWHPVDSERTAAILHDAGFQPPQMLLQALAYRSVVTRRVR